ncbi:metallophosphoesterase [Paracoccus sp. SCSIO 75233]|uniref:metallophosphoesterase n=1 Tax=Paracoccus sp. SCSIO 75233 TaxID=3017782 RepID=UPI0022F0906D|nr:metallophosphoesterase [Paracoccus sp. SCSIO 75233]WBU53401.1 metallophosphoesterase [Paracoccus sp. SCSIO 75233]
MTSSDGPRLYAIGDVHGQLEQLQQAHLRIERDGGTDARIIHLGDLIDRGPDSRGVIEYLIDGIAAGRDWHSVKGNHDIELPRLLRDEGMSDPPNPPLWTEELNHGAETTLASYGIPDARSLPFDEVQDRARRLVPQQHADFLDRLPLYMQEPGFLFVHAGIRPGIPLAAQSPIDLMWIRNPFHDSTADHGALVIHGHTPLRKATHYGNRVNIDSGAGYGRPLSAIRLDRDGVWLLGTEDAELMTPGPTL